MPPLQRRRGQEITFHFPTIEVDRRGNQVTRPLGGRWITRASETFDRANRAEVPGEQIVDVISVRIPLPPPGQQVALWSRAFFRGQWWDIMAPPAYRHGNFHTRHLTVLLRVRPDGAGGIG